MQLKKARVQITVATRDATKKSSSTNDVKTLACLGRAFTFRVLNQWMWGISIL